MRLSIGLLLAAISFSLTARADRPEEFKLFNKAVRAVVIAPDGKTLAASGDEEKSPCGI